MLWQAEWPGTEQAGVQQPPGPQQLRRTLAPKTFFLYLTHLDEDSQGVQLLKNTLLSQWLEWSLCSLLDKLFLCFLLISYSLGVIFSLCTWWLCLQEHVTPNTEFLHFTRPWQLCRASVIFPPKWTLVVSCVINVFQRIHVEIKSDLQHTNSVQYLRSLELVCAVKNHFINHIIITL